MQYCVKYVKEPSTTTRVIEIVIAQAALSPCQPPPNSNSNELSASSGRRHSQHSAPASGGEEGQSQAVLWADGEAGGR